MANTKKKTKKKKRAAKKTRTRSKKKARKKKTTRSAGRRSPEQVRVAQMIATLLDAYGSQGKVAEVIDVSRPTVKKMAGGHVPRTNILARVEDAVAAVGVMSDKVAAPGAEPEPEPASRVGSSNSTLIGLVEALVASSDEAERPTLRSILERVERRLDRIEDNQVALARSVGATLPMETR